MTIDRRFLVARSLARLVRRERGTAERAVEGYFAAQGDRTHFVSIEPGHCHLVLAHRTPAGEAEERTEVPRAQAEALLDVCSGKIAYDRSRVPMGSREAFLDRFMTPGPFDLLTVCFEARDDADAFAVPAWFGPEVTDDPAYQKRSIALGGMPRLGEAPVSDAALDALLDALDGQGVGADRPQPRANGDGRSPSEERVSEAFRRLAAATQGPAATPLADDEPFEPESGADDTAASGSDGDEGSALAAAEDRDGGDPRIDHVMQGLSHALGRPEWSDEAAEPRRPSVVELDRFGGRVRQGQR
jgi:CYTH domain-containing protein